jgi:hypothetical protein
LTRRTALLGALASTVVLAVPAAASATTITLDQACYSHVPIGDSQPVVVTLTGGTPGARFLLSAFRGGDVNRTADSTTGTFDAAGNATATLTNVHASESGIEPLKGEKVQFAVHDYGIPGSTDVPVAGEALLTNIALDVSVKPLSPSKPRRVTVSGSPLANQKLYGFIVKGKGTKVLRRISLGTSNVCGYATAKAVVAPTNLKSGTYTLYVNAGTKLDKAKAVSGSFRITVY